MEIEKFVSGFFTKQRGYKSFIPEKINTSWSWTNPEISVLLEQASREVGGLNSYSDLIPNIDIYIQMHIRTEANKSSRIEGTKTSIEEELMKLDDISPEKRDDYIEVHNYIEAMNHGITRIRNDKFPLSSRLIREIHKILMHGARGERKSPGEFRTQQNWIGGTMPSNAVFVPPLIEEMDSLLSDLEMFIHNDDNQVPHLIKLALIHYQFETIHPFQDGNGRIGRLIIPLYMLDKQLLDKPCFYISDFFERNRTTYYDALQNVRIRNDLTSWIIFFLKAAHSTAKSAKNKFKNAFELVRKYEELVLSFPGRPENNRSILKSFFYEPLLTVSQLEEKTGLSQPTIDRALLKMTETGMLHEVTGYSRNRVFRLTEYLKVFSADDANLLE